MRFLFTTIQFEESAFYGRVGRELVERGHDCSHLTISRLAARNLRRDRTALQLRKVMEQDTAPSSFESEAARIERRYGLHTLRNAWWPDPACHGKPERWCLERTVRTFRAVERAFDDLRPDVVVPEVGSETMRTAAHHVALDRSVRVFFLFLTIFPNPLRLYVDRYDGPMFDQAQLRELSTDERRESGGVDRALHRGRQADPHPPSSPRHSPQARRLRPHVAVKALIERDNEYLTPVRYTTNTLVQRARRGGALALREARLVTAVRLLPVARHRRLQDQEGDPALRRPSLADRAGR